VPTVDEYTTVTEDLVSLKDLFPPGLIIWRPVAINGKRFWPNLCPGWPFDYVSDDNRIGFVAKFSMFGENQIWEPEVRSSRMSENQTLKGVVLFTDQNPPKNWTHLIVSGVSDSAKNPGLRNKGNCVFCSVPQPYEMEDYLAFRRDLGKSVIQECLQVGDEGHVPMDEVVSISKDCWPDEFRQKSSRLVCIRSQNSKAFEIQYCHIQDEPAQE